MPTAPACDPGRRRLAQAAIARAVARIETQAPLEDGQAMREAAAACIDDAGRLWHRAWLLGQRLGLDREWERWRRLGTGVLALLVLLVVAGAWALARVVLGEAREINVVAALVSLLGLHALTLLLWCGAVLWPAPTAAGGALGRAALQLTARLPLERGPHALVLAEATTDVLRRARLAPWVFGGISHGIWTLSFGVLLAALALGFSLRAYRLTWETTILTPEFFLAFVQAAGWLPHWLGFPVPDAATLLHPEAAGADQRAWAWWLMGCVVVYGLAPRLLCALLCAAVWRRRQHRLAPDLADPGARRLLARFAEMAPAQVLDLEHRLEGAPPTAGPAPAARGRMLLGFELPPERPWPPPDLALPPGLELRNIAGSQQERDAVLQDFAQAPPAKLLVLLHGLSSPDRGTARFLREAAARAGACALLLDGAPRPADSQRWRDWLQGLELPQLQWHADARAAMAWLEAP